MLQNNFYIILFDELQIVIFYNKYFTTGISADAVRILLYAGLMKRDEADGSPVITQAGFQFLLLDTASQVNFVKYIFQFFFYFELCIEHILIHIPANVFLGVVFYPAVS